MQDSKEFEKGIFYWILSGYLTTVQREMFWSFKNTSDSFQIVLAGVVGAYKWYLVYIYIY